MTTTADTPPAATKTPLTPRERAELSLGHAAVEGGLERVLEIWPEAHIRIQHTLPDGEGETKEGQPYPTWSLHRATTVEIRPSLADKSVIILGTVRCHPPDQYDRIEGNRMAFVDALVQLNEWQHDREKATTAMTPMVRVGDLNGEHFYYADASVAHRGGFYVWKDGDVEEASHYRVTTDPEGTLQFEKADF